MSKPPSITLVASDLINMTRLGPRAGPLPQSSPPRRGGGSADSVSALCPPAAAGASSSSSSSSSNNNSNSSNSSNSRRGACTAWKWALVCVALLGAGMVSGQLPALLRGAAMSADVRVQQPGTARPTSSSAATDLAAAAAPLPPPVAVGSDGRFCAANDTITAAQALVGFPRQCGVPEPNVPFAFLHLHKTGGSTLRSEIRSRTHLGEPGMRRPLSGACIPCYNAPCPTFSTVKAERSNCVPVQRQQCGSCPWWSSGDHVTPFLLAGHFSYEDVEFLGRVSNSVSAAPGARRVPCLTFVRAAAPRFASQFYYAPPVHYEHTPLQDVPASAIPTVVRLMHPIHTAPLLWAFGSLRQHLADAGQPRNALRVTDEPAVQSALRKAKDTALRRLDSSCVIGRQENMEDTERLIGYWFPW